MSGEPVFDRVLCKVVSVRRLLGFLGWAVGSMGTVFFNEWLFVGKGGFNFPVTLTLVHMTFTAVIGMIFSSFFPITEPSNLAGRASADDRLGFGVSAAPFLAVSGGSTACNGFERVMRWNPFTRDAFLRFHLPITLAYWGNVVFNNLSFEDLEVDFLQMLKATGPAWVLLITVVLGTQRASAQLIVIIALIVGGTTLASYGELKFSFRGFLFAISATILSALRTAFIERSQIGAPIDGRQLYPYTFPFTLAMVLPLWLGMELKNLIAFLHTADSAYWGGIAWKLFMSITLAVVSNYGRYLWISSSSSIIYAVTGVMKDIAVIVFSLLFLGDSISKLKLLGASIAFSGVIWFTVIEARTHSTTKHATGPNYATLPQSFSGSDEGDLYFDGQFSPLDASLASRPRTALSPTLFTDDDAGDTGETAEGEGMADLLGEPLHSRADA